MEPALCSLSLLFNSFPFHYLFYTAAAQVLPYLYHIQPPLSLSYMTPCTSMVKDRTLLHQRRSSQLRRRSSLLQRRFLQSGTDAGSSKAARLLSDWRSSNAWWSNRWTASWATTCCGCRWWRYTRCGSGARRGVETLLPQWHPARLVYLSLTATVGAVTSSF
jgi:hypothetical protein